MFDNDERVLFATSLMDLAECNRAYQKQINDLLIKHEEVEGAVADYLRRIAHALATTTDVAILLHEQNLLFEDELERNDSQSVSPKIPGGKIPQNKRSASTMNDYLQKAKGHFFRNREVYAQAAVFAVSAAALTLIVRSMKSSTSISIDTSKATLTMDSIENVHSIIGLEDIDIDTLKVTGWVDIPDSAEIFDYSDNLVVLTRSMFNKLTTSAVTTVAQNI